MPEEGASRPQASAPPWLGVYPKGLDWNMAIEERAVFALLDEAALRYPDHCAIDFLGKRSSYRGLAGLVARAVCGFRKLGVQKGVRVGLFLPNCPYYVIAFFAILKAGGTVVNFNPLYAEQELLHQIEDSETEILVTLDLDRLQRKIAGLAGRCRLRRIIVCSMLAALPFPKDLGFRLFKWRELARIAPDGLYMPFDALIANDGECEVAAVDPGVDLAALQYTGGTTGTPKGVRLTHANLHANALQISRWFTGAEQGRERILAVLPLFHAFGMTAIMNLALALGGALIMLPRFDPRELLRTIERTRATLLLGVPTIFRALVEFPAIGRYDLSSLKVCVSGGNSLPADLQERFEALTRCRLAEGYGLTECSPVVACNPFEGAGKPGSVGLPLPRTTVEIVSLADGRSAVPAGERGEICVAGPQVMAGYWKQPAATAEVLMDGRLHTGDVGYLDESGYVFIVDRLKDVIITGGFNVYPRNVEDAILLHPAVADAAVAGIPDSYWGQVVKAYVVPRPGASVDGKAILAFLKDKLSAMEIPKEIVFADSLPKSAIGKTLKRRLPAGAPVSETD